MLEAGFGSWSNGVIQLSKKRKTPQTEDLYALNTFVSTGSFTYNTIRTVIWVKLPSFYVYCAMKQTVYMSSNYRIFACIVRPPDRWIPACLIVCKCPTDISVSPYAKWSIKGDWTTRLNILDEDILNIYITSQLFLWRYFNQ